MAFELPDLPYAHDALAGQGMSAETLEYHHDLHHKAYVDNGNKLIDGTEWAGKSMEDIITGTYDANPPSPRSGIFNNISQLWNHNQFWEMMGPGRQRHARRAGKGAVRKLRLGRRVQVAILRGGRGPVRLGLVLAGQERRRLAGGDQDRKRREPALLRADRACWAATCGSTATTSISATSARPICRTSSTSW